MVNIVGLCFPPAFVLCIARYSKSCRQCVLPAGTSCRWPDEAADLQPPDRCHQLALPLGLGAHAVGSDRYPPEPDAASIASSR